MLFFINEGPLIKTRIDAMPIKNLKLKQKRGRFSFKKRATTLIEFKANEV